MRRFRLDHETVVDRQTGLMWPQNASLLEFPLSWGEALDATKELNQVRPVRLSRLENSKS